MFLHELQKGSPVKITKDEQEWREWAVKETPNGKLLLKNSFFDILKKSSKIYLFHVTPNLKKIVESGTIYSSGGCLIGGTYSTPLFLTNGIFRVHNLGEYIFKKEVPRASYLKEKSSKPSILIIEANLPPRAHDNLIGLDYTKLGNIHLAIYNDLEYLLSFRERAVLQEILLKKIKQSLPYLNLASNIYHSKGKIVNDKDFFEVFLASIDHLPILGYIYFEVIAGYLMLFQDGKEAKKAYDNGEFYNAGYKDLMFDLFPKLLKGAGLGFFKPTLKQVIQYIKKNKMISKLDEKNFTQYLIKRIVFLTQDRLLNRSEEYINWSAFSWDFKALEAIASPLLGHLVHRELRNFGRFPDFYFYFDQFKALQAWNYWNHMGIVIPFNGVMPKGEVGINPAWPDLKTKVYIGEEIKGPVVDAMYIAPKKEIAVKIVPRLVDHRITIMRSKGRQKISGTFRD